MAEVAGTSLDECMVFWDPATKKSREKENEEAGELLRLALRSPARDALISFLRGMVPSGTSPRGKGPQRPRRGRGAGEPGRTDE